MATRGAKLFEAMPTVSLCTTDAGYGVVAIILCGGTAVSTAMTESVVNMQGRLESFISHSFQLIQMTKST